MYFRGAREKVPPHWESIENGHCRVTANVPRQPAITFYFTFFFTFVLFG